MFYHNTKSEQFRTNKYNTTLNEIAPGVPSFNPSNATATFIQTTQMQRFLKTI